MSFEYTDHDEPECDIRPARLRRIGHWTGARGGNSFDKRFPPLPANRRPECAIDDFDGRPPIVSRTIDGDPTYAFRSMLLLDERFPPIRKKEPKAPSGSRIFAAPRPQPATSYTYLMGAEGSNFAKIGWAKDPEARVAALQTGNPMALSILWKVAGPYESRLHVEFAPYRVRGEWFDFTDIGDPVEAVAAAVARIQAAEQ